MNKNFVTKYQSSVTNDDLPRLGKIIVRLQKNGSNKSMRVRMFANEKLTVEGNASITKSNSTTWDSKSLTASIPGSNNSTNYEFTLDDNDGKIFLPKYSLWGLWIQCHQGESIDISELNYAEAINVLNISSDTTIKDTRAIGNIKSLSKCTELSSLSLNNVDVSGNLSDIKNCPLSSLSLNNVDVSGNLSDIKNCPLSFLSLNNVDVSGNLSDIKNCPLSSLALNRVDVSGDIVNLNGKDLVYLRSTLYNLLGDISVLSSMKNLKTCELYYGNYSGNLSSVSALTNLTSLTLSGVSGIIGNLSSVSALTNLTSLTLSGVSGIIGNLSSVSALTNLTSLVIHGTGITGDISALDNLSKLKSVCFDNAKITHTNEQINALKSRGVTVTIYN